MAIDDETATGRSAGQPPGDTLSGLVPDLVHDLRNLLAPMKNAIELLRLRSAGDNRFTPGIAILERQFDGLGQLLERLSLAGRLLAKDARSPCTTFELAPVLEAAADAHRAAAAPQEAALELRLPATPVTCDGSAEQLGHALRVLLDEAAAAGCAPCAIRLAASVDEGRLEISVRATDVGSEALPAIAQGRATTRRGGRELGLALAARIAELHGGSLDGGGAAGAYTLRLPCRPRAALRAAAPPAGGAGLASRRVLVVDDNDAMQDSLTGLLAELGQQVRSARDGEEALRIARDWRPDLVLLDINLPKLNGYRVARELRSEFAPAEMSMVMMTGDYPVEAVRRGAAEAGVARCIDKMQAGSLLRELLADPAA